MPVIMKPTSVIIANLGLQEDGEVQSFFVNRCAQRMDKYVPYSRLQKDHLRQYKIEGHYIIYDKDYAKYQFYGMRADGSHKVQNYTTAGTGTHWDKKMWSAEGHLLEQEVQDKIRSMK